MSGNPSSDFGHRDLAAGGFVRLTAGDFWRAPLPHMCKAPIDRVIMRVVAGILSRSLVGVRGLERIDLESDPFVFVANHNQRLEAPLLPTLLLFQRQGNPVRFVADWPMKIVPGFARCYRIGGMITVTRKNARPRWLNIFRPLFHEPVPAFDRALSALRAGDSVGLFAEGTINRHPSRLLRGRTGAARLALAVGAPVVPAGIRFPEHDRKTAIPDSARLLIDIGEPIMPPAEFAGRRGNSQSVTDEPALDETSIEAHHHTIMRALERLSDKVWHPGAPKGRIRIGDPEAS